MFFSSLRFARSLYLVLACALGTINAVHAAPLNDNGDGTVTDAGTGLVWMRCAVGQDWSGGACIGFPRSETFDSAYLLTGRFFFAGRSDWRVPNIRELQTIVDRSRANPAFDPTSFQNLIDRFWSSSTLAGSPESAWYVDFSTGASAYRERSQPIQVRLVRGALLNTARPTGDYVDQRNGTVLHSPTALQWKRCVEGQQWDGNTCTGPTANYTAPQAGEIRQNFAGRTDWRIPTEDELLSLVDFTLFGPAINGTIFPAAPVAPLWSKSIAATESLSTWFVFFNRGEAGFLSRTNLFPVRLVRSVQFDAPTCTLSVSPASIAPGGVSVLAATCVPAATSYVWSGGTCAANTTANCSVTPAVTTTYTVMGTNAGSTGVAANATVVVIGSAPSTRTYSDNLDGSVTDPTTGLTWMRCAAGQFWEGTTCSGNAGTYNFDAARNLSGATTALGQSDWRLPSVRELQSIAGSTTANPVFDKAAFPNAPSTNVWTNTKLAGATDIAWYVGSYAGETDFYFTKIDTLGVRLVRGATSGGPLIGGLLSDARLFSDYVANSDGTATHTPTGLVWQRCEIGKSWNGKGCLGSASAFTWESAKVLTNGYSFAGKDDWRLPSKEELSSLVDYETARPAFNTTIFPNKTGFRFWSASPYAGDVSAAWAANLEHGSIYYYARSDTLGVHLVRGGQVWADVPLTVTRTGNGSVTSSALAGISCGSACSASYTTGTKVVLSATPDIGYKFAGWSGACTGTAGCTVTMSGVQQVSAVFNGIPLISGLPIALTFAPQDIGSIGASQTITLTNTGTATLKIASITNSIIGYTHTTTCGATLLRAASCSISVSFVPKVSGVTTGAITIASDASGSPHRVELSGTGVAVPLVSLNRQAIAFGTQNLSSTSAAQTVTLLNTGSASLNINGIAANGDYAATHGCGATLAPGANCTINVSFAPTAAGSRIGSLTITHNAKSSPDSVSLSGIGVPAPVCTVRASSTWINAGGSATLIASCLPEAFSYLWTGGQCARTNVATCTDSPATTTTYTVAGVNADGVGTPVSVTVTVPVAGSPVCTVSAAPAVISAGGTSSLSATCNPAATSYVWTNTGFGRNASGGPVSPTKTTMYTLVGSNEVGSGNPATTAVYVCNTSPSENYTGLIATGGDTNEKISGGIASDTIDGGPGFDTVIYNCNRSSFTVTKTTAGWVVSSTAEGLDTLTNVERIQFGNGMLALDISGNAGQAYRLYQAAFNRVPDNGGLKYWIGRMDEGTPLDRVAAEFMGSSEFVALYGENPTNADFLTKIYSNVLHRAPDQGGYDWWLGQLDSGGHTKISVLINFSESPENQAGVLNAIINGIDLLN
jgi:hypothetical protein